MSNYVTHEVMISSLTTIEEVPHMVLRSKVLQPVQFGGNEPKYMFYETALPPEMGEHLRELIEMHHEALARSVGHNWIGE